MFDPQKVREEFPIFHRWDDGKGELLYLDNAASTQKPQSVIDAISNFYASGYANVHRSPHRIGAEATDLFEGSREKVAKFIGADDPAELILAKGTTEAINLIAAITANQLLKDGDVILSTISEHHSNMIPWRMAAERAGATVEYVQVHGDGFFDLEEITRNWNSHTKVFAFQHASNVLGTIHPVEELCRIARERDALSVVDGAQSAPHMPVDVKELGCDFFALSSHKMCGPSGVGALWGRRELLESFEPIFGGGEMILRVSLESTEWNEIPFRFEPGTPNIAGLIGWGAAVDYLQGLGMQAINDYIESLAEYAVEQLNQVGGLKVFGPPRGRTGAVSFWLDGVHPHDIASILDMDGIAVRAGHHCAEPLMHWLEVPATTRASFYIYNTKSEVDALVRSLEKTKQVMGYVA